MSAEEPATIVKFLEWFRKNGGRLHDDLHLAPDALGSGLAVKSRRQLTSGVLAVSCPFSLAINLENIRMALSEYSRLSLEEQDDLSPRQLICTYIALHDIIPEDQDEKCLLRHRPYLSILPKAEKLLTPLYFCDEELNIFKGTNLYGAALDQRNSLLNEWQEVRGAISVHSSRISEAFSFETYQLAATYLSSRAFPSTLLSRNPSLFASPSSYPVLLPGIDMFNHKRRQPVSWTICHSNPSSPSILDSGYSEADANHKDMDLAVGLVVDTQINEGEEVFNNYGPKPNSSLILAYGFSLPDNPDDTTMLKIGSSANRPASKKDLGYEVGRNANGTEAVWNDVRKIIMTQYREDPSSDVVGESDAAEEIQIDLETAGTLSEMVSSLIARLPDSTVEQALPSIRQEVQVMWRYYVQGQMDLLGAFLEWLEGREVEAVRRAEELGISVIGDESCEEEH